MISTIGALFVVFGVESVNKEWWPTSPHSLRVNGVTVYDRLGSKKKMRRIKFLVDRGRTQREEAKQLEVYVRGGRGDVVVYSTTVSFTVNPIVDRMPPIDADSPLGLFFLERI